MRSARSEEREREKTVEIVENVAVGVLFFGKVMAGWIAQKENYSYFIEFRAQI